MNNNGLPLFNTVQKMWWWFFHKDSMPLEHYHMDRIAYWPAIILFVTLLLLAILLIVAIVKWCLEWIGFRYYKNDVNSGKGMEVIGVLVEKENDLEFKTFYFCVKHGNLGVAHHIYEVSLDEYYKYKEGDEIKMIWFYGGLSNNHLYTKFLDNDIEDSED